jgi:D-alanyl-D-alanine dipeptidase
MNYLSIYKTKAHCALFLLFWTVILNNITTATPFNLIEIKEDEKSVQNYGLLVNLAYKTSNNITEKPLYPKNARAYLHPIAYKKLKKATELLRAHGYGIIVLDAWRPYLAGARLWNKAIELDLRDLYCPPNDSAHSRGTAVDVTLFRLENKDLKIPMPSDFDQRLPKGPINPDALNNAKLLKDVMNKAGFVGHLREWWHFNLPNSEQYPIIKGEMRLKLPRMKF